jgi:hypothetical protein
VPTKSQLDELEKCINVVIEAVKALPNALMDIERLRLESMLMRLLDAVVANEAKKQNKPT